MPRHRHLCWTGPEWWSNRRSPARDPTTPPDASNAAPIGALEAKTTLGQLLDRGEHGEVIVITRHGASIARLVPFEDQFNRAQVAENLAVLDAIDDGRS